MALFGAAEDYRTPAGLRQAVRTEAGPGSILPGGRLLNPYGKQFVTGSGPFGLAISPNGDRVVTANGGPDLLSLTFLEGRAGDAWRARELVIPKRRDPKQDDDDWKSAFMGLAFDGDQVLYASEGESGQVRAFEPATGKKLRRYNLNAGGFDDSYSGDMAFDAGRGLLYVVDQANFRVAVFDVRRQHRLIGNVRVGRLPFAIALSPDGKRLYVTGVGMFAYQVISKGLSFPPYGFPSKEASEGVNRETAKGELVRVPGLGDPNAAESNSLAVVDVADAARPAVIKFIRTGLPFGNASWGGSSPAGVMVGAGGRVWVSNSTNDSISVIDPVKLVVEKEIRLVMPGLDAFRGVMPVGLAFDAGRNWVLVAEGGINAVGVIDAGTREVLGHIPAGWFPTRVAVGREFVFVTNAKGHGTGANATVEAAGGPEMGKRRGTLSQFRLPEGERELARLTGVVRANNGFDAVPAAAGGALPAALRHVVIIVKENRTFDEVFGDYGSAPKLARYGRSVTPNHHALADRFAMSDNFYADSEVSVDGHHWLVGSYPNVWTESTLMSGYAGAKKFKLKGASPGRLLFAGSDSSVHPEEQLEAGTLWHHLERHRIPFYNFGFELSGVDEGKGLKPTGARFSTNIPMPEPLYRNTSRQYPGYNTNIPDQYRADQFIAEMKVRRAEFPRLLFVHLPQDHTAEPRPADGYPTRAAYVADNDYALGRIIQYLSHVPEWKSMAVFITEDDAAGGVDHVDSHRTVMLMASPFVKRGCVAHTNTSFSGLLKTVFRILGVPPLNLYDATAADLSECFVGDADSEAFDVVPASWEVFDPKKVREPMDPRPGPRMDDPREVRRGR